MKDARNVVVAILNTALLVVVFFILVTQNDSIIEIYDAIKVKNLISSLEQDVFAIGAVSAVSIGYFFIIFKEINADISELEEDDKANVAFALYKVAYAELTIIILLYLSIVISGNPIYLFIFTIVTSAIVTYLKRNLQGIPGDRFSLIFIFLILALSVPVIVFPVQVAFLELVFFIFIVLVVQYSEKHSAKNYQRTTTDYSFAESKNKDGSMIDELTEDRLSPEIIVLLLVVLLVLVYILNLSIVILIYILISVPALMMFIKFWSYTPAKYDIRTNDDRIEDVFICQERYSQGYLTILTEEGEKRILLHNVTEIKPNESDT